MYRLNDSEMLAEIMRELTKCNKNMIIPSELVLLLEKRIEAQRSQVAVINSLNKEKTDILQQKYVGKQTETKLATPVKMTTRRRYKY